MKRILISLVLCTLVSAWCTPTFAATKYGIKVGGVDVTSDNASNVTGSNIVEWTSGQGYYVRYDAATKTLRMNNVKICRTGKNNRAILNESCDGLRIVIEKPCRFEATDAAPIRLNANTTLEVVDVAVYTFNSEWCSYITGGKEDALCIGNRSTVVITGGGKLDISCSNNSEGNAVEGVTGKEKLIVRGMNWFRTYHCKYAFYNLSQLTVDDILCLDCGIDYNGGGTCAKNLQAFSNSANMPFPLTDSRILVGSFNASEKTFMAGDEVSLPTRLVMYRGVPVDVAHFPDNTFRNYLLSDDFVTKVRESNGGYSTHKYLQECYGILADMYVSNIDEIDVSNMNILTLEGLNGIQYFTGLKRLNCSGNKLHSLDLSANVLLETVDCSQNETLTSLTLPQTGTISELKCNNTALTTLDVSKQTGLKFLTCNDSKLATLKLPTEPKLRALVCSNNLLTTLNVSQATQMSILKCENNKLTILDLGNNKNLMTLKCGDNQLSSLNISKCTGIDTLTCQNNKLTAIDVADMGLYVLDCSNNSIRQLELSRSTGLTSLQCQRNQLTSLNLMYNTKLTGNLDIYSNNIKGEAMDEFIANIVPSVSNINVVDHSDNNEGNEITAEQVKTLKMRGRTPRHLYNNNAFTATDECLLHDIWIKSRRVTNHGTGVTGASYDASTKTLTLTDANIQGKGAARGTITERGYGIYCEEPGVTLEVKGTCTVAGDVDNPALVFYGTNTNPSKATITGDGTLQLKSNVEAIYDSGTNDTLTIGGAVTVEAEGTILGYSRYIPGRERIYYNSLLIKDNAVVKAKSSGSPVLYWKELMLEDGFAITEPEGAYWDAGQHSLFHADSSAVDNEWVTIRKAKSYNRADVNRDGTVDSADIVAVIKEMPDGDMKADVNGDGAIDSADIVAVIKAMK